MITRANCPICNQTTKLDKCNEFRPFCSERCSLVDLGKWVDEKYSIIEPAFSDGDQDYPETH